MGCRFLYIDKTGRCVNDRSCNQQDAHILVSEDHLGIYNLLLPTDLLQMFFYQQEWQACPNKWFPRQLYWLELLLRKMLFFTTNLLVFRCISRGFFSSMFRQCVLIQWCKIYGEKWCATMLHCLTCPAVIFDVKITVYRGKLDQGTIKCYLMGRIKIALQECRLEACAAAAPAKLYFLMFRFWCYSRFASHASCFVVAQHDSLSPPARQTNYDAKFNRMSLDIFWREEVPDAGDAPDVNEKISMTDVTPLQRFGRLCNANVWEWVVVWGNNLSETLCRHRLWRAAKFVERVTA